MLEYDIMKSPGLGAFLQAGKAADTAEQSQAQTRNFDASTENTLGRLFMDQEMHPLKISDQKAITAGRDLDNTQKQGKITDEERERRQVAMDRFFNHLGRTGDLEEAHLISGVPKTPKFKQLETASPEKIAKLVDRYTKESLKGREERAREEFRIDKQNIADTNRAIREQNNIRARGEEERKSLEMRIKGEIQKAAAKAQSELPKSYQEGAMQQFYAAQSFMALGQIPEATAAFNRGEFLAREAKELASASTVEKARWNQKLIQEIMGKYYQPPGSQSPPRKAESDIPPVINQDRPPLTDRLDQYKSKPKTQ